MDFKYKCKSCAYRGRFQDGSDGCSKFNIKVNLEKDGCSWHKGDGSRCCLCDKPSDNLTLWCTDANEWYVFCPECYSHIHTCSTCRDGQVCPFQYDKSEPPYITKTIRQGFMTMQQQVKNPNLIAKHCTTCHCFWEKENCHKETNGVSCPNWQLKTDLLR